MHAEHVMYMLMPVVAVTMCGFEEVLVTEVSADLHMVWVFSIHARSMHVTHD